MAIDTTFFATRRRNVTPTSSTIRADMTRDMDCSGAAFLQPPEDGQFISCLGDVGANPKTKVFHKDASITALDIEASGLRMVWASAMQSDRQALGDKRVPVLWKGGIEVECKLFNADKSVALLLQYPIGTPVSVGSSKTSVALKPNLGDTDASLRLVLEPVAPGNEAWVVGYVTGVTSAGKPINGDSIKVMLYDHPQRAAAAHT
jgi:hypothetical protein